MAFFERRADSFGIENPLPFDSVEFAVFCAACASSSSLISCSCMAAIPDSALWPLDLSDEGFLSTIFLSPPHFLHVFWTSVSDTLEDT